MTSQMPSHITRPTRIAAPGEPTKVIEEFVGRVNSGQPDVSIARMVAPAGWEEAAQTPAFDEYTIVLRGLVRVEYEEGVIDVVAGEAIVARRGERVRYSTPKGEAEYIAVCLPAFSPDGAIGRSDTVEAAASGASAGSAASGVSPRAVLRKTVRHLRHVLEARRPLAEIANKPPLARVRIGKRTHLRLLE